MNLDALRQEVEKRVSKKRFTHILGVERCAVRIGEKLLSEKIESLRVAALLHDITKELSFEEHLSILKEEEFPFTEEDIRTPGVLHSFTAPAVIKRNFSKFAVPDILSAVMKHTVGDKDMSLFDKIIFISDYVEDTRYFESCIAVRKKLFENFENLSNDEAIERLNEACIASIDGALDALDREKRPINTRMYDTKKSLLNNKLQN